MAEGYDLVYQATSATIYLTYSEGVLHGVYIGDFEYDLNDPEQSGHEVVCWTRDEWLEDPSAFDAAMYFVCEALTKGASSVARQIGKRWDGHTWVVKGRED